MAREHLVVGIEESSINQQQQQHHIFFMNVSELFSIPTTRCSRAICFLNSSYFFNASIVTFSEKKNFWKKKRLPSTLDMEPSPSTWNPRPSTLDKKIDSSKSQSVTLSVKRNHDTRALVLRCQMHHRPSIISLVLKKPLGSNGSNIFSIFFQFKC